jgi:CNT family concentrative nucleoside transporter
MGTRVQGLLGYSTLLIFAWALSENRWRIPLRIVLSGLVLQWALALLFIRVPYAAQGFLLLNLGVEALQRATEAGTGFVFGYLGGGTLPFAETSPGASFVFAFRALPMILVVSALASLLFHWGVLQLIVNGFAFVLRRVMGIGGALGLGAAVHIFVGNIEGPLLVRPWLGRMQRGELFALMTCGMAGIAGTVMVLYASILGPVIPGALGHILIAAVISTPAALAVSALMAPFHGQAGEKEDYAIGAPALSSIDALAKGTADGIIFFANITATLIVAIACVSLVNMALGLLPLVGGEAITLQYIFAWAFRPVMWLIGLSGAEAEAAARLMATKTVLNEFIAYVDLSKLGPDVLSEKSRLIVTYALCGFANFGSAGIMIGGLTAMCPDRKQDIVDLGLRSVLSGTIATCMSGAVVGVL